MSLRPSVPCRGTEGTENAAGFRPFPPAHGGPSEAIHCAPYSQTGCAATRSGRESANPWGPGEARKSAPLNGNALRATMTASTDQLRVKKDRGPDLPAAGIA